MSVPCPSSGECVFSVLTWCGALAMLLPVGVDEDAGIMIISCSVSGSAGRFVDEFVILCIILYIFLLVLVGLLLCLFADGDHNMFGSLEVKMVSGLPWEESEASLFTSTDSLLRSLVISSWMRGAISLSFCLCFAFSNLDCASAASFEQCSNSLLVFVVRCVGSVPFLLVCCAFFCGRGFLAGWSRCVLGLGPGWSISEDGSRLQSAGACLFWACLLVFFSVNKNSFIFSWFQLNYCTILHATKCISLDFDSLTIARSFFLITVFLRLCVSNVIVVWSSLWLYRLVLYSIMV